MWVKRKDDILFFSLEDLVEIKIVKGLFYNFYLTFFYKNGMKKIVCKSNNYDAIFNVYELIINSITNNRSINLNIPYNIKNNKNES